VIFSHGSVLSVSNKYDSVNKRTQEYSELMKFIRQLANRQQEAFNFRICHPTIYLSVVHCALKCGPRFTDIVIRFILRYVIRSS